ncbi:MAG TPA: PIN domain-containing protein [Acidobacteriota bacterium]|nr:PIN domain-containing protein [Acidobacteriota bacterium]
MTLVADTGALYALYDRADKHHEAVRDFVEDCRGPIVVPLPVIAELDYFLVRYLGVPASLDFLESVESGAFSLDHMTQSDVERCRKLIQRFQGLQLGFVDAAVIAVAERLRTREILTIDHRDFRAVGEHEHGSFVLRPADGQTTS